MNPRVSRRAFELTALASLAHGAPAALAQGAPKKGGALRVGSGTRSIRGFARSKEAT